MKALIFGANGQDGHYLTLSCKSRNMDVIGISRNGPWLKGSVADRSLVDDVIREHQPDFIFHLAAISTTRHDMIYDNHAAIATGTVNILEAVRRWSPQARVFITGSGLQFVNHGQPIKETDPFSESSVYAVARNYSVSLARYFRSFGLKVYVGYLFHHESPLRSQNHVSQKIVRAALRIKSGKDEILELGDMTVEKEWTYAGDVADGIMTLVSQDKVFEAVIGSGQAHAIEDWVAACFDVIGKDWQPFVKQIDGFRPEYQMLVSNPQTMRSLGWSAKMSLQELAKLMMSQQDLNCDESDRP